jgi:hypothetical protein
MNSRCIGDATTQGAPGRGAGTHMVDGKDTCRRALIKRLFFDNLYPALFA